MLNDDNLIPTDQFMVPPHHRIRLKDLSTEYEGKQLNKENSAVLLEMGRKRLSEIQDELYAHSRYSVLIILQAMDAAGKDGAIKHIMSGLNPQGVHVHSFKAPTSVELDHDYFWRHNFALPARGEIAIHNRSHYENVLVTRVHPEYILNENLPGVEQLDQINAHFWEQRFRQIRRYEENLAENGMLVLKFFLHISKDEQRKRFLERIDDPSKNWKFSLTDVAEREHWDDYMNAYEEAISNTSTAYAPWFVIPADDKWFARLSIATIIYRQFSALKLNYPIVSDEQKAKLMEARKKLMQD